MTLKLGIISLIFLIFSQAVAQGICHDPGLTVLSSPPSLQLQGLQQINQDFEQGLNAGALERRYQNKVRSQIYRDLLAVYCSTQTRLTFASFSGHFPGKDLGYGLHVVRRLDSGLRTVLVNESWPLRKGQIQPPDEIRVRSRVFNLEKERGFKERNEDYVFARYRILWNEQGEPVVFEEPQFSEFPTFPKSPRFQRRVPISVLECRQCHPSDSLVEDFRVGHANTKVDFESIVQPAYYGLPLAQTKGWQELKQYVRLYSFAENQVDLKEVEVALIRNSQKSLDMKKLATYLRDALGNQSVNFLGQDHRMVYGGGGPSVRFLYEKGIYRTRQADSNGNLNYYLDALESEMESIGWQLWWFKIPGSIPSRISNFEN